MRKTTKLPVVKIKVFPGGHMPVKKIKSLDKNILDYNRNYFYNDEYDEKVLQKTAAFVQRYVAWKGYHCAIELDVFSEMNLIIALQRSAIETILKIQSVYKGKNNKISSLITDDNRAVMKHIDEQNKIKADCFGAVENNLYFIDVKAGFNLTHLAG